jgi:hypothetical protein
VTTSLAFLGDEWFARAGEVLCGVGLLVPGANARVRYEVGGGGLGWCQVIDDGRITCWERAELADADVTLRWGLEDAFEILTGGRTGTQAAVATTIVEDRASGPYVGVPPPFDFAGESELSGLRRLPGANLTVHGTLPAAPFGATQCSWVFVDGQFAGMAAGFVGHADVEIGFPFRQLMRLYRGEISWQEALQFGTLGGGSIESLMFLAGIVESPPWQRAMRACAAGRAPLALAALGEVTAQDSYRNAMGELMATTAPPTGARLLAVGSTP